MYANIFHLTQKSQIELSTGQKRKYLFIGFITFMVKNNLYWSNNSKIHKKSNHLEFKNWKVSLKSWLIHCICRLNFPGFPSNRQFQTKKPKNQNLENSRNST